MKIKIMYPNENGKIEITKEELEKLLTESYQDGYSDGLVSHYYTNSSIQSPLLQPSLVDKMVYCSSTSLKGE